MRQLGNELDYLFNHVRPSGPIQRKRFPCDFGHFVWAACCTSTFWYRYPMGFSGFSGRRTFGDDVVDDVGAAYGPHALGGWMVVNSPTRENGVGLRSVRCFNSPYVETNAPQRAHATG